MLASIRAAFIAVLAGSSLFAHAQLTKQERSLIEEALWTRNWRLSDLDSARRSASDTAFPPLLAEALDTPLSATDKLLDLHAGAATGNTTELLLRAFKVAFPAQETGVASMPVRVDMATLKGQLRPVVSSIVSAMLASDEEISAALGSLTGDEKVELQALAVRRAGDSELSVRPPQLTRLKSLLARVDLPRIRSAGVSLVSSVDDAIDQLKTVQDDVPGPTQLTVGSVKVMILPKRGDSVDVTDSDLVIALGGHNSLSGRLGAGVFKSGVLIDLGDDSSYFTKAQALGCGLFGVGYAFLGAARTSIVSGDVSVGAGIGGIGVARFEGAEARVRSGSMVQGFGYQGVGLCVDSRSDSYWKATTWAQGAARTGGIGWLVDRGGNDFYESSGVKTSSGPAKNSYSQGFSSGYGADITEDAGGIGLLTDINGSDVYTAESQSQGSADWRGLGSLFDRAGNDRYFSGDLSGATAIHQSYGLFADLAGDDMAVVGGQVGQGAAYADSVSVWLDREGTDRIVSGALPPGFSSADSLCIRIKAAGSEGISSQGPAKTGNSIDAFSTILTTTAVVASLNAQELEQSVFLRRPRLDLPPIPVGRPSIANSDPGDLDKLFDQGSGGDPVAVTALAGAGRRALDYAVRSRLAKADGLERQLIVYLARRQGEGAAASFGPVAVSQDDAAVASALLIGAELKSADLAGMVPTVVQSKRDLAPLAIVMAGKIHSNSSVAALLPLLVDKDPRIVRLTIVALALIGDESGAGSAQALLVHSEPLVREESARLLALFPQQAQVAADPLLTSGDEFNVRVAIHLLGLTGTPDALTTVATFMRDPRVGVRYSALQELTGRMSPVAKRDLPALANDPDLRVRALAKRAQGI